MLKPHKSVNSYYISDKNSINHNYTKTSCHSISSLTLAFSIHKQFTLRAISAHAIDQLQWFLALAAVRRLEGI